MIPVPSDSCPKLRPAVLSLELFSTREEAEARRRAWADHGPGQIWLQEVSRVEVSDLHALLPARLPLRPAPGGTVFAVMRVG
jgi:hypothetical protein